MVGKLETPLKGASSDALIDDVVLLVLGGGRLRAANGQGIVACLDRELVLAEPGDGERDPVRVLAGPLDVIGRIGGNALFGADRLVEHRKKSVETDGGPIEWREIVVQHKHILRLSDMTAVAPFGCACRLRFHWTPQRFIWGEVDSIQGRAPTPQKSSRSGAKAAIAPSSAARYSAIVRGLPPPIHGVTIAC
jgi:hypothetical protein